MISRIKTIRPIGKYIKPPANEGAHEVPSSFEGILVAIQRVGDMQKFK
jgi:hypothetical protein